MAIRVPNDHCCREQRDIATLLITKDDLTDLVRPRLVGATVFQTRSPIGRNNRIGLVRKFFSLSMFLFTFFFFFFSFFQFYSVPPVSFARDVYHRTIEADVTSRCMKSSILHLDPFVPVKCFVTCRDVERVYTSLQGGRGEKYTPFRRLSTMNPLSPR